MKSSDELFENVVARMEAHSLLRQQCIRTVKRIVPLLATFSFALLGGIYFWSPIKKVPSISEKPSMSDTAEIVTTKTETTVQVKTELYTTKQQTETSKKVKESDVTEPIVVISDTTAAQRTAKITTEAVPERTAPVPTTQTKPTTAIAPTVPVVTTVPTFAHVFETTRPLQTDPTMPPQTETTHIIPTEPTGEVQKETSSTPPEIRYDILPGFAVTDLGGYLRIASMEAVSPSPDEMRFYMIESEHFSIESIEPHVDSCTYWISVAGMDKYIRVFQFERNEFIRGCSSDCILLPQTINGNQGYWAITQYFDHCGLVWDDGSYTFMMEESFELQDVLLQIAEAMHL